MNKNVLNLFSETIGALSFSLMVSTGFILESVLEPGSGRLEMLGHGRRHETIGMFLELSRHEWGNIHLFAALLFLVFVGMHIILHRKWIAAMVWGSEGRPQSWMRRGVAILAIVIICSPLVIPFLGEREDWSKAQLLMERSAQPIE